MPTNRLSDEVPCRLCGRGCPRAVLTKHHCHPKSRGGTVEDIELICGQCHAMVHATYTNQTLETLYPSIEQLRQAPELAGFLKWVRKQPVTSRVRTRSRSRKV